MKRSFASYRNPAGVLILSSLVAATILCGCGKSEPQTPASEAPPSAKASPGTPAAAQPAPAAPAPAAATPAPAPTEPAVAAPAPTPAPAAPPAATPAPAAPAATAIPAPATADATQQFVAAAAAQPDPKLGTIGSELAGKVGALSDSLGNNEPAKAQLTNSLQSLTAGKDAAGLAGLYQSAKAAGLTPEQTQLAKEVGSAASAYVVQKNFASLEGSQTDVATIVNSLRKGEITPALPALERVGQNANLTAPQKQLLSSLGDQYAPGLSKAAGALQGLKGLGNLGGSSK